MLLSPLGLSQSSAAFSRSRARTAVAILVGACVMVFAAAVYWVALLNSHSYLRSYTQDQAWVRVTQMSRAIAAHVGSMFSGLDYTLRDLARDYETGERSTFLRGVQALQTTYPSGTVVQVAVADAQGRVVYSSLNTSEQPPEVVSIDDREHFQVHLKASPPSGMYIGPPVQGRVSQRWSIQLSRALHDRQGQFAGVLVLSLSPQFLSQQLQSIYDNPRDVILLLRDDGTYLARSQRQEEVLGRRVSADRQVMLSAAAEVQGSYGPVTGPDGIQRLYAWSRVHDYPILVSTGLDSQAVHDPLNQAIAQSLWRNGLGTALIFLGAMLTAWLAFLRWREEGQRLQSEQRFARLSQEVPGGLFQYGLDAQGNGVLLFSNPGFYAVHCIDATAAHGDLQALVRRVHPADVRGLRASIAQAIEGRKSWVHKYRVVCPVGGTRWLHGHAQPQPEQDGALLWHGYILDVTQDEALQNALRQSEERLRLTIGAVRDGLWQWDCEKDTVVWDARCYEIVGRPDQSLGALGLSGFVEQLHPADRARVCARLEQHLAEGEPFRVEMRLRQQDGGWRWVESRGEVTLRDAQGRALRMLGMHSDIQERVDQTHLVSALLDRGSALVLVASHERQMVYANQRAAEYFGLDPHRPPEPLSFRVMHGSQESFERFGPLYQRLKTEGVVRAEWELRGGDGRLCWFDMQGTLLDPSDPEGNVIWTLFDVDARHRAEAELVQTRLRMEAVIDRFPSGILVSDSRGQTILAANDMLVSMLDVPLPVSDLVGQRLQHLVEHLPADLAELVNADAQCAGQAEGEPGRMLYALPSGRHLEVDRWPLRKDQRDLGWCWVFHDVTDYKQRESQLEALATSDPLTGARNRRAFLAQMDMKLERLRLGMGRSFALIMLDVDHFKRVNDTYGHAVGDEVLKQLVVAVTKELRKEDMLGRLGGEEFAVLLAGLDQDVALKRAESLRQTVERLRVEVPGQAPIRFTVSLGVCVVAHSDVSVALCLERADAAMYHAKRHGRNRVTCWSPSLSELDAA